ncbi:unnamed protein product [Knipowitschia caucasica]
MEDRQEPQSRGRFQGKCGWMKKAHGRVLFSYKDRYVSVDRTEILLYENEDQKNCLERVDLENYEKCQEMKSGFKKKHKLILLRSPKSPNKVQDLKFQAQSEEDRRSWIKALSDAIDRAKNKVFDQVTVDESSNLDHVTRSRPKRTKRPPTRIHMKEVADVSSDGLLRLDLDLDSAMISMGSHASSAVDGDENLKETASTEQSDPSQTRVLKPPMPPSKEAPAITEEEEEEEVKEEKEEEEEVKVKDTESSEAETSPNLKKKKLPLMPPNKPLLSLITPQDPPPTTAHPPTPPTTPPTTTTAHPPTPPSKTKKPTAEKIQEALQNEEEGFGLKTENIVKEIQESPTTLENNLEAGDAKADEAKADEAKADEAKADVAKVDNAKADNAKVDNAKADNAKADNAKADNAKADDAKADNAKADDAKAGNAKADNAKAGNAKAGNAKADNAKADDAKAEVPVVSVTESGSVPLSPKLGQREGENDSKKAEEKSVDSGQHSDDNSGDSESEDPLAIENNASDDSEINHEKWPAVNAQTRHAKGYTSWLSKPQTPIKPLIPLKPEKRSLSSGNILLDSCEEKTSLESGGVNMEKLEKEVAAEMEDTSELLTRASRAQGGEVGGGGRPEHLLTEAMEKLLKADQVLRACRKLTLSKNARKSW